MYKKSFQTIKNNPVILLGFALPIIFAVLAIIPMFSGISSFIQQVTLAEAAGVDISEAEVFRFVGNYFLTFAIIMLVSLSSMFLIMPPVLNKIYDACSGNNEAGWYKRGLKRSWWKIFVTSIMLGAVTSMLSIVLVLVLFIPIAGVFVYIAIMLGISVITIIAHTSVIAEDDYGTGLSNIFNIGFKYFFKQLGAFALVNIPTFLLSIAIGVITTLQTIKLSYGGATDADVMEFFKDFMPMVWIFVAVICLYSVFSTTFTYVFSMNSYLDKKQQLTHNPNTYINIYNQSSS